MGGSQSPGQPFICPRGQEGSGPWVPPELHSMPQSHPKEILIERLLCTPILPVFLQVSAL